MIPLYGLWPRRGNQRGGVPISRVETTAHIAKQQREDPELLPIITYLERRQLPEGLAEKDAMPSR